MHRENRPERLLQRYSSLHGMGNLTPGTVTIEYIFVVNYLVYYITAIFECQSEFLC